MSAGAGGGRGTVRRRDASRSISRECLRKERSRCGRCSRLHRLERGDSGSERQGCNARRPGKDSGRRAASRDRKGKRWSASARCMCAENPTALHNSGRQKRAKQRQDLSLALCGDRRAHKEQATRAMLRRKVSGHERGGGDHCVVSSGGLRKLAIFSCRVGGSRRPGP